MLFEECGVRKDNYLALYTSCGERNKDRKIMFDIVLKTVYLKLFGVRLTFDFVELFNLQSVILRSMHFLRITI